MTKKMGRVLAALGVCALMGASPLVTPAAQAGTVTETHPSITELGRLSQHGRWYADGEGRAFLTAGVNMVYKHTP